MSLLPFVYRCPRCPCVVAGYTTDQGFLVCYACGSFMLSAASPTSTSQPEAIPFSVRQPSRTSPQVPDRIKQLQRERVQPAPPLPGATVGTRHSRKSSRHRHQGGSNK